MYQRYTKRKANFKHYSFQCLEKHGHWWKMQQGSKVGYAAKYNFVCKDAAEEHEKELWYFGDLSREEAEGLLEDSSNPQGSFLVRRSTRNFGMDVLSLKFNDTYRHYNVNTDGEEFWFKSRRKFESLSTLINSYMENKSDGVATKLSKICNIPDPLEDRSFHLIITGQGSTRK